MSRERERERERERHRNICCPLAINHFFFFSVGKGALRGMSAFYGCM
jgi:hypothetical protein